MTENYEHIAPLCVAASGLIYAICDYLWNGGRNSNRKDSQVLVLSRRTDEVLCIGDNITIMVVEILGDRVKLGIEAPRNMPVHRKEVYEAIQREHKHPNELGGEG